MNAHFILSGITMEHFFDRLQEIIHNELKKDTPPAKEIKYLTPKEVARMLRISLPTLHEWKKLGMINAHKIGNKVLYKESEVDEAVTRGSMKYKRGK